VNSTFVNFGEIRVAGFDYQIDYKYESGVGTWTPAASATQTYHYTTALTPGAPATDRASMANDDGNWSPRLKLTTALGWKMGPYTANVDGRYVGRYQDYDSSREIGNFWFCDANLHYAVGQAWMNGNALLAGTYLEFGAVNLFNKLPQYSNYFFGLLGYDPTQSDIRGRFVYVQLGAKL
jgi:outer membrane receptor protein involved in Fe transport